ncbi:hypothetical protein BVRB_5g110430 [Beta vulgaris subsp. vulgaris]|nr:hypothetical protein BVRB_5g110430 [Beta vulgaris subsp. vulgaris]
MKSRFTRQLRQAQADMSQAQIGVLDTHAEIHGPTRLNPWPSFQSLKICGPTRNQLKICGPACNPCPSTPLYELCGPPNPNSSLFSSPNPNSPPLSVIR